MLFYYTHFYVEQIWAVKKPIGTDIPRTTENCWRDSQEGRSLIIFTASSRNVAIVSSNTVLFYMS